MFIIINTVFVFANVNLEAAACLYACALFLFILVALRDVN